VVARVLDDAVVCDLRTVDPADDTDLAAALTSASVPKSSSTDETSTHAGGTPG
jgi:hypothetical protein